MNQAAIPSEVSRLAGNYDDCAPGHRFLLYFPVWDQDFGRRDDAKHQALKQVTGMPARSRELLAKLEARQRALFEQSPHGLQIEARSTAPFATGLGNEHPVENGFAFLTPYGLPYLAGSGVKGVLRRAAEELALFPSEYSAAERPTLLDVWWLFGFEAVDDKCLKEPIWRQALDALTQREDLDDFIRQGLTGLKGSERDRYVSTEDNRRVFIENLKTSTELERRIHRRGALDFWDVFPQCRHLAVEIMTPHYHGYYFNGQPPHDAGQPSPVPFLAVPDKADFVFHVICTPERLPPLLRERWKPLMETVFQHTFEWLGFGAKTAVGYGVMGSPGVSPPGMIDDDDPTVAQRLTWPAAALEYTPNNQELIARFEGQTARVLGKDVVHAVLGSPEELEAIKKRQKRKKTNIRKVQVEAKGNQYIIQKVFKPEG